MQLMAEVKKPTPQERKERTAELRVKHQSVFDSLKIPDAEFIPKMAHHQKGLTGIVMGFFESELSAGIDLYTEKVSMSLEPEDPNRTLYRWRNNPHFREEYPTSEPTSTGVIRYFVPVDELEEVSLIGGSYKPTATPNEIHIPQDPSADTPLDQMTLRDYAAITLGVPSSQKSWLNEIIKESLNKKK